jgi:hypothetical protein
MISQAELQIVLRALHRVASDKPDEEALEQRGNDSGPHLWHEGVALWGHVLKVAELNENDPHLKSAWEALVVQARKYLAESDAERRGLSRN